MLRQQLSRPTPLLASLALCLLLGSGFVLSASSAPPDSASVAPAARSVLERRSPAEDDSVVRGSQPLDAKLLRRKQNPETLMNPEYCRDAREDIDVEGESAVLARLLAPVVIRGSRGISEDPKALRFRQPP